MGRERREGSRYYFSLCLCVLCASVWKFSNMRNGSRNWFLNKTEH